MKYEELKSIGTLTAEKPEVLESFCGAFSLCMGCCGEFLYTSEYMTGRMNHFMKRVRELLELYENISGKLPDLWKQVLPQGEEGGNSAKILLVINNMLVTSSLDQTKLWTLTDYREIDSFVGAHFPEFDYESFFRGGSKTLEVAVFCSDDGTIPSHPNWVESISLD